ncbi:hypothetical protein QUF80_06865 [Desulfococcaceae bacterium HSG8]|nr:hypothetical protein [Desulfococcaceae bacterium HSG8]
MKQIAEALKALFDKISDFFDIFDLSFFVSGAVFVSAVVFWAYLSDRYLFSPLQGGFKILVIVISCYVSGLLCFASGRWLRITLFKAERGSKFDSQFQEILEAHGLTNGGPFREYLGRTNCRSTRRLYIRLWAEIRQTPDLAPSLSLLRRYWVMAATYDGLSVAVFSWAIVIGMWCSGVGANSKPDLISGSGVVLILILMSFACLREAERYVRYQNEELVATIAVHRAGSSISADT